MWKIIRKMFFDLIFVIILYLVSYTNRDSNAILQVQHLTQFFLNTRNSSYDFTQITSINDYWKWLQTSFISNIRVQPWYNNEIVVNMTDYLDDKSNLLIGWATMRQLRLKLNASCQVPVLMQRLFSFCKGSYSIFSEERQSFAPGWMVSNNMTYTSSITNAFIYRTSAELDSYIYIGNYGTYASGGYVYEFHGSFNDLVDNLTILRELTWIDQQTRAIMIELNLYNPNIKLFTSVVILIEISDIGEVFPSAHIEPMQMYMKFNDFSSIFYLIIAIIYMLFILYMTIFEIYFLVQIKKKYFHQIRSYIEWGIIGCSWAGVGVYIWRYLEADRIGNYFRQTNGIQYINLQLATYVNEILTFLLGFCCFFGTIRLLRLFDIYPRVNMFAQTLRRALNDIASFSLMFFLVFFAFVILFYLLFVSKMFSCSSVLQTSGMLFEMLLLKFDFREIHNADAFLGPFVFALFIYFVVFICVTMFIAIITGHLRYVRKQSHRTGDMYPGVMTFIVRDLIQRIGLKRLTEDDLQERRDRIMRSKYKDPVKQLPEKIDALLFALEKIYGNSLKAEVMKRLESERPSCSNPHGERRKRKRVTYSK